MLMKDYSTQFTSQNISGHKKNLSENKCFEIRYSHPQKRLPTGGVQIFVPTMLLGMQQESLRVFAHTPAKPEPGLTPAPDAM
jgi:hypothetical protein